VPGPIESAVLALLEIEQLGGVRGAALALIVAEDLRAERELAAGVDQVEPDAEHAPAAAGEAPLAEMHSLAAVEARRHVTEATGTAASAGGES